MSPAQRARRPKYISASSQSLVVDIVYPGGTAPGLILNLNPLPDTCTTTNGTTVCNVSVVAQSTAQLFVVTFFDQPNGQGNALSTSTVPVPTAQNGVASVSLTLAGVVASVALNIAGTLVLGQPGTATLVITPLDADGNVIPGNAPFSAPIQITSSSAAVTLSTTTVTSPSTVVTVSYNGAADPTLHVVVAPPAGPPVNFSVFGGNATPAPTPGPLTVSGVPAGSSTTQNPITVTIAQPNYFGPFTVTTTNGTVTPPSSSGPNAAVSVNAAPGTVTVNVGGGAGQVFSGTYSLYAAVSALPSSVQVTVGGPGATATVGQAGPVGGNVALTTVCNSGAAISVVPTTVPIGTAPTSVTITAVTAPTTAISPACVITATGAAGSVAQINVDVNENDVNVNGRQRR